MSKLSKAVSKMNENKSLREDEVVINFMRGENYILNPLDKLKMIASSSIFGEPSYYRSNITDSKFENCSPEYSDEFYKNNFSQYNNLTTTEIFTKAIDDSLDFDFKATLDLALELRKTYLMRLNPQIIIVRASIHPKRKEFTKEYPREFSKYVFNCAGRADDVLSQLTYYLYINNGNKSKIPSILKRSIAKRLNSLNNYQVNKYKNHEIGMINAVRLTHAHSPVLDELMKTGTVTVSSEEQTWEQKRSAGMDWSTIIKTTKMGHMALLRNLRGIFHDIDDKHLCDEYLSTLLNGVSSGKQLPFRYWSAYKAILGSDVNHKQLILDTLENCIDKSVEKLPHLKGRTMCLSDNSGSAWTRIYSDFGTILVSEIDNLSSIIAASCSDEGYVGVFGDHLKVYPISHRNGVLSQNKLISKSNIYEVESSEIGAETENGIWEFFRDAIKNKDFYDNIFIFSDQQAGTGGLYGLDSSEYKNYITKPCLRDYINVFKLIQDYRKYVNPKVNVFSIQTAGFDNMLLPQMSYRTALLSGWTGKEILFASEYIKQWDNIEERSIEL